VTGSTDGAHIRRWSMWHVQGMYGMVVHRAGRYNVGVILAFYHFFPPLYTVRYATSNASYTNFNNYKYNAYLYMCEAHICMIVHVHCAGLESLPPTCASAGSRARAPALRFVI